MPHGGPFARDEWSYDVWAQFLANRGYLVLQPNFRGSTGYGKNFVEKGLGQWGRAMQDDIDDGVKWLVDQGKADPKRVCIMGASFGGYAAMWAAARNPDIYRCAISFAGISDVDAMLKYDRKSFSAPRYYRNWRDRVQGDKKFDLDSVSPLTAVNRISIPLLIAHGGKDENVPPSQSRKLHEALVKAGKKDEFVVYDEEKHGFEDPKNHIDFLKRVDAFLDAHNPATLPDAGGGQPSAAR
jgi:dipeptidyl aminopeptidase/acylaminoacyl peptidase